MIGSSKQNTPKKVGRPLGYSPIKKAIIDAQAVEKKELKNSLKEVAKEVAGIVEDDAPKNIPMNRLPENPAQPWMGPAVIPDPKIAMQKTPEIRFASEATITAEEFDRLSKGVPMAQHAAQEQTTRSVDGVPLPSHIKDPEVMTIEEYNNRRKGALSNPSPTLKLPLPKTVTPPKADPRPVKYEVTNDVNMEALRDLFLQYQGKEVVLGLVCYKDVSPVTMISLLSTMQKMGDRIGIEWHFGDAIIENARNHVADLFMKREGAEWLLFLDDDVVPPFGRPDVTKRLCRLPNDYVERDCFWIEELLSAKKTLIGGMYFGRSVEGRPMYAEACFESSLTENQVARNTNVIEAKPTDWVATGCMLIHRSVFEDMQTKFPELAPSKKVYTTSLGTQVMYETKVWGYFNKIDPSQGEDVSFCHRAQMLGHQPHIHLGVRCQHIGMQAWNYKNVKGGLQEESRTNNTQGGLLRKVT